MAHPLAKTFETLTSTANPHAVEVLVAALDLGDDSVRALAATALIQRSSTRGQVELVRRLDAWGPETRRAVEQQAAKMDLALRHCLLHGDEPLRKNALEVVRLTENFGQIAALLDILQSDRSELFDWTVETLRDLTNRLYEHCRFHPDSKATGKHLRNAEQVRQSVLAHLEQACAKFTELSHAEEVVESLLALGHADHFAVKKILWQSPPECRELAGSILLSSRHAGVMQLVLDSLSKNYPHPKVFEALQRRDDPEFVCHLLRWVPKRLSQMQLKNLRQIESIAWLDPRNLSLQFVPAGLQAALVSFVLATGLRNDEKVAVQQWLVKHGSPEGRLAAGAVLASLDDAAVQNIVFEGLDDENPEIQAWAVGQLRSQGIPETFTLLVDRLDSPLPAVRDAAREELAGFNFERMLNLFDHLDPAVCRRAGELIQKIHPDCLDELKRALEHPIRRRRIRAARAAQAMDVHEDVVDSLRDMLADADPLVRRTAAEILGTIPSVECIEALQQLRSDPSPRVRECVEKSLEQMRRQLVEQIR